MKSLRPTSRETVPGRPNSIDHIIWSTKGNFYIIINKCYMNHTLINLGILNRVKQGWLTRRMRKIQQNQIKLGFKVKYSNRIELIELLLTCYAIH